MRQKELYLVPETEVLELRLEANVLQVGSPTISGFPDTGETYDGGNQDW